MSDSVSWETVCFWQKAIEAIEQGNLHDARRQLWKIRHFSAKIWFNLSTVDLLACDYRSADEKLVECLQKDPYLALAYFQRGNIACLQGRLFQGQKMFDETLKHMRNADMIDYHQLGLSLRFSRQQVMHNQKAIEVKLQGKNVSQKISADALETLPRCLFRPAKSLVDNLRKQQFLQKAKVVSSIRDSTLPERNREVRGLSSSALSSPQRQHCRAAETIRVTPNRTPPPSRPPPRLASTQGSCSDHDNVSLCHSAVWNDDEQSSGDLFHSYTELPCLHTADVGETHHRNPSPSFNSFAILSKDLDSKGSSAAISRPYLRNESSASKDACSPGDADRHNKASDLEGTMSVLARIKKMDLTQYKDEIKLKRDKGSEQNKTGHNSSGTVIQSGNHGSSFTHKPKPARPPPPKFAS